MKVVTIVGARPQFIKSAPVSKALRENGHHEFLIHTGQHYDYEMSQVFFDELGISAPDVNLGVGSGHHGWQTGKMLIRLEELLAIENPGLVIVYGDTNSTLAGALAACKLRIPLAHVESGLRSFNKEMPEEHNRVLTDHCSDMLFCPTKVSVENLAHEGITHNVHLVGDTMYDAVLQYTKIAQGRSTILQDLGLQQKNYMLATVHRPCNTDIPDNLRNIMTAFLEIGEVVMFPVHPRTREKIAVLDGIWNAEYGTSKVRMIEPVSYLDMLVLEQNAKLILTDSGGMQKEAHFFSVPCVTLRRETEWVETVESGWNVLVGTDRDQIMNAVKNHKQTEERASSLYGEGRAAHRILALLIQKYA